MKNKRIFLGIMILVFVTVLGACDKRIMFVGSSSSTKNKIAASYKLFTGTDEKKISLKKGETLAVDYQSEVKKGELTISLYDPDDQLVQSLSTGESGNEKIEVTKDGKYNFKIKGKHTKGSYKITYNIE
jgi:flagellar hook assembly protein FlgD